MLPSKFECDEIVSKCSCFYRNEYVIDGYRIHVYNYRLANYDDFATYNAFELRGLTFVEQEDGSWQRYLMLHKFFNIGENRAYDLNVMFYKKIVRVQEKLDGSMIRFIKLPNGKVYAKTKMGFTNEQAMRANRIYEINASLRAIVNDGFDNGIAHIYEYISPFNQIVIQYDRESLVPIQSRNENTGEYIHFFHGDAVDETTLDDLYNQIEFLRDKEGWVITFEDGTLAKLKTPWYMKRHRLFTNVLANEAEIVKLILEEEIDDILPDLYMKGCYNSNAPVVDYVKSATDKIRNYVFEILNEVVQLKRDYVEKFNCNRKEFAISNLKNEFFSIVAKELNNDLSDESIDRLMKYVVDYMLRTYNKKEKAAVLFDSLGINKLNSLEDYNV